MLLVRWWRTRRGLNPRSLSDNLIRWPLDQLTEPEMYELIMTIEEKKLINIKKSSIFYFLLYMCCFFICVNPPVRVLLGCHNLLMMMLNMCWRICQSVLQKHLKNILQPFHQGELFFMFYFDTLFKDVFTFQWN